MSDEDDDGAVRMSSAQGNTATVDVDLRPRTRDPRYDVFYHVAVDRLEEFVATLLASRDESLREDQILVRVEEGMPANHRRASIDTARSLLPEEIGYGEWATVLSEHVVFEKVPDPYAELVAAMVAMRVEEDGAEDTPELRARTRARIKATATKRAVGQ